MQFGGGRKKSLAEELTEAFLGVPELNDPHAAVHRRTQVKVDPRRRIVLDVHPGNDGVVLLSGKTRHFENSNVCHEFSFDCHATPGTKVDSAPARRGSH
jgi:hypothetical protein